MDHQISKVAASGTGGREQMPRILQRLRWPERAIGRGDEPVEVIQQRAEVKRIGIRDLGQRLVETDRAAVTIGKVPGRKYAPRAGVSSPCLIHRHVGDEGTVPPVEGAVQPGDRLFEAAQFDLSRLGCGLSAVGAGARIGRGIGQRAHRSVHPAAKPVANSGRAGAIDGHALPYLARRASSGR